MSSIVKIKIAGREYEVKLDRSNVTVNGEAVLLQDVKIDVNGGLRYGSGERQLTAVLDRNARESFVLHAGREFELDVETDHDRLVRSLTKQSEGAGGRKEIRASMPGLVIRTLCEPEQQVQKGQPVLILEAMKMENEIRAPMDGTVREIKTQQGQAVERGDLLMVLE